MADNLLYFTELLSMPVVDLKGRRIGRVKDAAMLPLVHASRIDRLLVGGADAWLAIRFDQVRAISLAKGIELSEEVLVPYHDDEYLLRIARDLLDQQIIDVTGRKVVRVNDITMGIQHDGVRDTLNVLEVDIGVRSILRRVFQGILPPAWIRRLQRYIPPNSISWEFANVVEPDPLRRLRLNISYTKLEQMHPADLADIVEEMAPDEAADLLSELEEETSEEILDEMDSAPKTEVRELLEFREDTAGGMMNTEYVVLHDGATVADAMTAFRGNEDLLETLNTLFLVDSEERLAASIPMARLFIASGIARLKDLASDTLIQVTVDEKQDRVTELFDKYNLLTLPVVDEDGKLAGVITADDVISVLRQK